MLIPFHRLETKVHGVCPHKSMESGTKAVTASMLRYKTRFEMCTHFHKLKNEGEWRLPSQMQSTLEALMQHLKFTSSGNKTSTRNRLLSRHAFVPFTAAHPTTLKP